MIALFLFELKYYFNNLKEIIQLTVLFFIITLLGSFGFANTASSNQVVAAAILWIALIVSISVNGADLFKRDFDTGKIDLYQLGSLSLESVALAKWAAYYCAVLLSMLGALPCAGLLLSIPTHQWLHAAIGLASGAAALSILTALAAALLSTVRAGAILGLLILPLTIPIIIFGTHYLTVADIQPSLVFLGGFSAFLLPIYCFVSASALRAAN